MSTKRQIIDSFRMKLKQRNADTSFTNQFLYNTLMEHAKWLIRREISAGRIYRNTSFFQTLGCQDVSETSMIDNCCPVKTNCKIYRTHNLVPDMWNDTTGPVIKTVTSVDGTTDFFVTSAEAWQNKRNDPYQKMSGNKYCFYANGYIWFPEHNPHKINVTGFYMDDLKLRSSTCEDCSNTEKECVRFLETKFMLPDWLEAEMFTKATEQLVGITQRLPEDEQIDKNETRKN